MKLRFRFRPDHPKQAQTADQDAQALAYAKKGIVLAILSGIVFSVDGLLIKGALQYEPFSNPNFALLAPMVCAGFRDFCAAIVITLANVHAGRRLELGRSFRSKPGRFIIAGALIGSLLGMGSYMAALQLAGPAYVLPITTLYPAVASVLAVFTLKENISPRAWLGLALCVVGAAAVGYTSPEGQPGNLFYWGLAFAGIAAVGWGTEGVCAASGMDFIEPLVALNMYFVISASLYLGLVIPVTCLTFFSHAGGITAALPFFTSKGTLFVACSGILGTVSYSCWYKAMNMTGVSRSMALNISYALWGILLSAVFTKVDITASLIVGALVIFAGMCLVIGNPRDMLNLRKVERGSGHAA